MSDRLANVSLNRVDDGAREALAASPPSGAPRMGGDLRLEDPVLVLACCAPRFAAWLLDRRGPWLAPVPNAAVERALGGLGENGQPLDVWYRASEVQRCADELARSPFELGAIDPRLKAYVREYAPHVSSIAGHVRTSVERIVALYREAAASGHGVDVYWHPNP